MKNKWIYRIGLSENEVSESELKEAGFTYKKINPLVQFLSSVRGVIGVPYKRGASVLKDSPRFFDCSSLVAWAAVEAGMAIPRIAIDQFVFSKKISRGDLIAGDLVFSNSGLIVHTEGSYYSSVLGKEVVEVAIRNESLEYKPGTKVPEGVDHVGVYVGAGRVVHATLTKGVIEEELSGNTCFKQIVGYGRIINETANRFVVEVPEDMEKLRSPADLLKEIRSMVSKNK